MNAEFPHPLDDNGPPNFVVDAVDELRRALERFEARRDEFAEKANKVQSIRDREDVGRAADLIGFAKDVEDLVNAERAKIAEPHAEANRAVNAYARKFWEPVLAAMTALQAKVDDWVRGEEARIRDQQREQEEEEARLRAERGIQPPSYGRATTAPAKKRHSYRGDFGRQAIVTEDDVIEIVDVRLVPDLIMSAADVHAAIIKVAKPLVKQGIELAGIRVTKDAKTQIRR